MHIGRAEPLPPPASEVAARHVQQARVTAEASRGDPRTIADSSVPTGEKSSQPASYNPVIDLIQRAHTRLESPPSPPAAKAAYEGTPPAPSVVDLSA